MRRKSMTLVGVAALLGAGQFSLALAGLPVEKATVEAPDGRSCEVSAAAVGEDHEVTCSGELIGTFKAKNERDTIPNTKVAKPDAPQPRSRETAKADNLKQRLLRSVSQRYFWPDNVLILKVTSALTSKTYWTECWGDAWSDIQVYEEGNDIGRINFFPDGRYSGGYFHPPEGVSIRGLDENILKQWVEAGGFAKAREKKQSYKSTFVPAFFYGQPQKSISSWNLGAGYDELFQNLKQCYDKSLKADPKKKGTAAMELNVSPAGHVTHVAFNKKGEFPTVFMDCADKAALRIIFKAPGKDASVDIDTGIIYKDPKSPF